MARGRGTRDAEATTVNEREIDARGMNTWITMVVGVMRWKVEECLMTFISETENLAHPALGSTDNLAHPTSFLDKATMEIFKFFLPLHSRALNCHTVPITPCKVLEWVLAWHFKLLYPE